ncbi:MAG: alcohol dehydrogenase catalytic domain-containing protein [Planctomycetota bacterium]
MPTIEFEALDYRADQTFAPAHYRYDGDEQAGWRIDRDGVRLLELGAGFRLLRVVSCGVCSTDLARHFLPFPLPQVIGHEVVAKSENGTRYVVEINASHTARGVSDECAFCRHGLPTHCPSRVTLGIHDLPGGFGSYILAPLAACIEVPASVPDSAAVLVEPFAAALHGVQMVAPKTGERIAVLGPRRLGMLVLAALAGVQRRMRAAGSDFAVAALVRDPALVPLAREFGATEVHEVAGDARPAAASFDVVIDTTGNPDGFDLAVHLARREVHLKSTHGRPASGLRHLTELVVDELAIARFPFTEPKPGAASWDRLATGARPRIAWLASTMPPAWLMARAEVRRGSAAELAAQYDGAVDGLPRADVAVVDSAAGIDAAIRPRPSREDALIRPRGEILVLPSSVTYGSALLSAIVARDLRLSSSRCGEFGPALDLIANDSELAKIGERLVTHRFAKDDLACAFATARSRGCIKAVVMHDTVVKPGGERL